MTKKTKVMLCSTCAGAIIGLALAIIIVFHPSKRPQSSSIHRKHVKDNAVSLMPEQFKLGHVTAQVPLTLTAKLANHSDKTVRVVGFKSSCGCSSVAELPEFWGHHT
jgi:hypothetical protein